MLEVETSVDERAASLLGWRPLEIDHAPDPQLEVPATRAAASFALWRGDVGDARRAVERGWALVRRAEDWALAARMAATYLEVQAAVATDARERHALPEISGARQRGKRVLTEAESVLRSSGVASGAASRLEADANLATARAFAARLEGHDDPVLWDAAAQGWERAGEPYQVARTRWRQAEAALPGKDARVGRAAARGPLLEAARIARELGARPLLRELTNLASRALINLPGMEAERAPSAGDGPGRGRCPGPRTGPGHGRRWAREPGAPANRSRRAPQPTDAVERLGIRHRGGLRARRGLEAAQGGVRAVPTRARGARADRRGPHEPRDRRAPVHQPEDRRASTSGTSWPSSARRAASRRRWSRSGSSSCRRRSPGPPMAASRPAAGHRSGACPPRGLAGNRTRPGGGVRVLFERLGRIGRKGPIGLEWCGLLCRRSTSVALVLGLLEGSTGRMPIEGTNVRTASQGVDATIVMGRPRTFGTAS